MMESIKSVSFMTRLIVTLQLNEVLAAFYRYITVFIHKLFTNIIKVKPWNKTAQQNAPLPAAF